jgi:hypothetical protein
MSDDWISAHEVRLLLVLQQQPERWHANGELAEVAKASERTARAHTARLAEIGVLEVERVFPGNKYRLVKRPAGAAKEYLERVQKAREVFGL